MVNKLGIAVAILLFGLAIVAGCGRQPTPSPAPAASAVRVLAVETFLADMAQNVAGDRLTVDALIPLGVDPHAFEPAPQDIAKVSDSDLLIMNGAGFEATLQKLLENAGGTYRVIEAAAGLVSRTPRESEVAGEDHPVDPHFWLDPNRAVVYVENIRDGLAAADPANAAIYAANADAYIGQLRDLDRWIAGQVQQLPEERRVLVTNHESFGYFADRYGFRIVGTIMPSVSSSASPSAAQLAWLVDRIRATGAPAIFMETGTNPQLAEQIASETGAKVVTDLYSHSITAPDGPAPTYIDMMRHNTEAIVAALK